MPDDLRVQEKKRQADAIIGRIYKDNSSIETRVNNLESNEGPSRNYILIRNEQTVGTQGGTFTSGAWQTRVLNTEVIDTGSLATLAANQITLAAGTYQVRASAPAYRVDNHQIRLQNITDGTTIDMGTPENSSSGAGEQEQTRSILAYRFTLATAKVLELQHRGTTTRATDGFGRAASFGTEIYSIIEFWSE